MYSTLSLLKFICISKLIRGGRIIIYWIRYCFNFFFHYFQGRTWSIWKFPGQGSNQSFHCWPTPQLQQRQIWAISGAYNTACSSIRSLTHWALFAGDQTHIVFDTSQVFNPLSHNGNSLLLQFNYSDIFHDSL